MKLTNQKAFDKIYKYFIFKKNKRSISDNGYCRYRAGELKCAVGVLIPDDDYDSDMEGSHCRTVRHNYFEEEWKDLNMDLLSELQRVHDTSGEWSKKGVLLKAPIKRIAQKYKLTIPKEPK